MKKGSRWTGKKKGESEGEERTNEEIYGSNVKV